MIGLGLALPGIFHGAHFLFASHESLFGGTEVQHAIDHPVEFEVKHAGGVFVGWVVCLYIDCMCA